MSYSSMLIMGVITFYFLLLVMRIGGIIRQQKCPRCKSTEIDRVSSRKLDKLLNILSLYILPVERHQCQKCGWEGVQWRVRKTRSEKASS